MQLEKLAITLRPRSAWEAIDLGAAMAARWRRITWLALLCTHLPLTLGLMLIFPEGSGWPSFLVWWLLPVYDRMLLFIYSRALFGETPTLGMVLKALPGLLKAPGLIAGLFWRRFSTARPFLLPVWVLEQQTGANARRRFRALGARGRGAAFWLTLFCSNMMGILWFSMLAVIAMLTPEAQESVISLTDLVDGSLSREAELLFTLASVPVFLLIEPYFVACGFSLYLNRRSELEGWDMELAFRRLSARKEAENRRGSLLHGEGGDSAHRTLGVLAALVIGLSGWLASPSPAWAESIASPPAASKPAAQCPVRPAADDEEDEAEEEEEDTPTTAPPPAFRALGSPPSPARKALDDVLADPVFGHKYQDTRWQMIPQAEEDKQADHLPEWMKLLGAFGRGLSAVGKVLVALVAIAALGGFAYLLWRTRHQWWPEARAAREKPTTLFGLDIRPESLPDDLAGAALQALRAGQIHAALSLLYRGALSALVHHHQVELVAGDTEEECLQRSRQHLPEPGFAYLTRLVRAWQLTAYAHTPPPLTELEDLCLSWAGVFAPRPLTTPGKADS